MTTRRDILKGGAGIAAILASGKAPAYLVKSMLAARQGIGVSGGAKPSAPEPLCFTAEASNSTVSMAAYGTPNSVSLLYSRDGSIWSIFEAGSTTITLPAVGDKVYLKAGEGGNYNGFGIGTVRTGVTDNWEFSLSGTVAASGNTMSLIDGERELDTAPKVAFAYMFENCSSLVSAPELPATILSDLCYAGMFSNCSNLEVAPYLPVKNFPKYPNEIFLCYGSMFYNCIRLNRVSVGLENFMVGGNTGAWLGNVSSNGTFECPLALGTQNTIRRGETFCPDNWTVVNF